MLDIPRDDFVLMLEAGYIYLAMGKFAEARQIFEGVIGLAPKHEVPQVALANVLFAQRKYLPTIRILKEAIRLNPKSAFAHVHLGEAFLFYGKRDEAFQELEAATKLEPRGKTGDFARSLTQLMKDGYDPTKYAKKSAGA